MLSEHLPRRLPRAPVHKDWRADAQRGADALVAPLKAPSRVPPEQLLGSPLGGLIVRVDATVGAVAQTFTDLLGARVVEKPGTLIESSAQHVDQQLALTRARAQALRARALGARGQAQELQAVQAAQGLVSRARY